MSRGRAAALLAAVLVLIAPAARAQNITIDGTLSPVQTLLGPNYTIAANLGRQVGGNLFQSFGKFGLATGESADFTGPAAIANIIGRVTGGSPSAIDGRIQSSIAGANLFLINPFGLVFGPNATVNVSGSFHAATADYLKLADGAKFQATHPDGSTFSAAPPAAFGFLTSTPAPIAVNGSTLGPVPGTFGLVGGPVTIAGGALLAPGGTIHIVSVAGPGEVPVDATQPATVTSFGAVAISGGAKLDVSNSAGFGNAGSVLIRAGALSIDDSEIDADNYGAAAGGQVVLQADSQIALQYAANVHAIAFAGGGGADITIETGLDGEVALAGASTVLIGSDGRGASGRLWLSTGQLSLGTGATIVSSASGSGSGGAIAITAATVVLDGAPALISTGVFSSVSGTGTGGSITISAAQLVLRNGAGIIADTAGTGVGGLVRVAVGGDVTIDSGASLGTTSEAAGDAGNVVITAGGAIAIDMTVDEAGSVLKGIGSLTGGIGTAGNAGNVAVSAEALSIAAGGEIASLAVGSGNAKGVSVAVADQLSIVGTVQTAPTSFPTGILARAGADGGSAGNVSVSAGNLGIFESGGISAATADDRAAGMITVTVAGLLAIVGTGTTEQNFLLSGIGTNSAARNGSGAGGAITVHAGALSLTDGGKISSTTFGSGAAGSIAVTVDGALMLSGGGNTGIFTSGQGSGPGGSIAVSAGELSILDGGEISGSTLGAGKGGSVGVSSAGGLTIDGAGQTESTGIFSTANGGGNGGTITVNVAGLLSIAGTGQAGQLITAISSRADRAGDGGSITVNAGAVSVGNTGKISANSQGSGAAGSVAVDAEGALVVVGDGNTTTLSPDTGIFSIGSGTGPGGVVTVAAGSVTMTDGNISASAKSVNGGDVSVMIGGLLDLLQGSEIKASVNQNLGNGNGGNLTIDAQQIVLGASDIYAQAFVGRGGNILIRAQEFVQSSDSDVSASSQAGISGTVTIAGEETGLNSSLVVLPSTLRKPEAILRAGCAARGGRPQSRLVEGGRGGLPADPAAALPAVYLAGRAAAPAPAIAGGMIAGSGASTTGARGCD